ncbi:MAG TPA: tetraacyldisaccharide 4'-kinase [Stellaceae bacterium]|nr:tetraacyldisaccharide 4'-kinase [Stellaceae bacterium]
MPSLSAPEFWARRGGVAQVLRPISWGYAAAAAARQAWARPWQAPIPVICVGNLVAGGAGKTPVAIDLARRLTARGHRVHLLSRGYGGRIAGPQQIDPSRHRAADVGDEPLLLAEAAPTWIARDRVAGARAAIAAGAAALVLDDGLQNPTLAKDLSLLVIDGGYGLGNRRVLPAGPLRQPRAAGLALTDAVVLLGADERGVTNLLASKTVLRADLVAVDAGALAGTAVVAFAGMGRPVKFFATLETIGARPIARHAFADHHPYAVAELERLQAEAAAAGAMLVTTAKDAVRLSAEWRRRVTVLSVAVAWRDEPALDALLERVLTRRRHG